MKNKAVIIPLALLVYLGVMSYIGLPMYHAGEYFKYFGIIGVSLLVIVLLHFSIKRRERLRREREEDIRNAKQENQETEEKQ